MIRGVKFPSRLLNASWSDVLTRADFNSPSIFLASSQTAPRPLSSFDTDARWQPVTAQSARSRRSYGKIEDREQSIDTVKPVLSGHPRGML